MSFIEINPTPINSKYADPLSHRVLSGTCYSTCAAWPSKHHPNILLDSLWHRFCTATILIPRPSIQTLCTNICIDDQRVRPLPFQRSPKILNRVNIWTLWRPTCESWHCRLGVFPCLWGGSIRCWNNLVIRYLQSADLALGTYCRQIRAAQSALGNTLSASLLTLMPHHSGKGVNLDSSDHTTFFLCSRVKPLCSLADRAPTPLPSHPFGLADQWFSWGDPAVRSQPFQFCIALVEMLLLSWLNTALSSTVVFLRVEFNKRSKEHPSKSFRIFFFLTDHISSSRTMVPGYSSSFNNVLNSS